MSLDRPTIFDRREARRRKILENSENRLKIITGQSCDIQNNAGSGLVGGNACITHDEEDLFSGNTQLEQNYSPSQLKFEENLNFRNLQNMPGSVEISENNDSSYKNCFSTHKKIQIIYVAVAIGLRILIETNIFMFLNSLVGAFILTKVVVISVYGWKIPETSRLIASFLLISGISSQKTNFFVLLSSAFFELVKDFAVLLYVFVFSELFVNFLTYFL